MTPHKHAAAIKAWADGKPVRFRTSSDRPWHRLEAHTETPGLPAFDRSWEYEPEPDPSMVYRVGLWRPSDLREPVLILVTRADNDREPREQWGGFIRWVSDWVECAGMSGFTR